MFKKRMFFIIVLLAIFLVTTLSVSFIAYPTSNASLKDDYDSLRTYETNIKVSYDGQEDHCDLPHTFDLSQGRELQVYLDVSAVPKLSDKALDLTSAYAGMDISLDGKLLYSFRPHTSKRLASEGFVVHYVNLGGDGIPEQGKEIEIRYILQPGVSAKHRVDTIFLGTRMSLLNNNILREMPQLLVFLTLLIMFAVLLVVGTVISGRKHFDAKLLELAFLALLVGLYVLFQTRIIRFYIPYTAFLYVFEYYNLAMMPLPVMFIICTYVDERFKKLFNMLIIVLSANLIFQTVTLLLGVFEPQHLLLLTHIVLLAVCIATVAAFILTDSERYPQKNELLYSVLPLAISLFLGLISYTVFASTFYIIWLLVGTIMFIILQVAFIVKRINSLADKVLLEKYYEKAAMEDNLTGVGSRLAYNKRLDELEATKASISKLVVLLFDLDGLKYINDNFGHHEGDNALRFFANNLAKLAQQHRETLYRIGGDEFILFIVGGERKHADKLVMQLNELLATYPHEKIQLTYGVGIEEIECSADTDINEKLIEADRKMYENKAVNGNARD